MSKSSKHGNANAAETSRPAADKPSPSKDLGGAPPAAEGAEKLSAELEQAQDRFLRLQAELENYRKRSARDFQEQLRYANMGLLRDLLPVLDNAYRAIEAAEKGSDGTALLDGFRLLARQLESVLTRHHCEKIEALDAPFDPHLHEAISQQPSADHPPQTVILVTQDGYRLHDRVVRPSQVIVSSIPKETEPLE
ncbi:MAG: nucleotide exchange factor GrpE [Pirellulales bacterium]|nr:nucleotide exchange factor GrpE [Pirellulales bacterium]